MASSSSDKRVPRPIIKFTMALVAPRLCLLDARLSESGVPKIGRGVSIEMPYTVSREVSAILYFAKSKRLVIQN